MKLLSGVLTVTLSLLCAEDSFLMMLVSLGRRSQGLCCSHSSLHQLSSLCCKPVMGQRATSCLGPICLVLHSAGHCI